LIIEMDQIVKLMIEDMDPILYIHEIGERRGGGGGFDKRDCDDG